MGGFGAQAVVVQVDPASQRVTVDVALAPGQDAGELARTLYAALGRPPGRWTGPGLTTRHAVVVDGPAAQTSDRRGPRPRSSGRLRGVVSDVRRPAPR
jgi:hypothetical protein